MAKPADAYLEARVLNASRMELVDLLYSAALTSIRLARAALDRGDISGRSREISKAQAILIELTSSLDAARAPDLVVRLTDLYAYIGGRLAESHAGQQDLPPAESHELLSALHGAWKAAALENAA